MKIQRRFTQAGTDPLDTLEWDKRESVIREPDGTVVFQMRDIEVPKTWSQVATDILAQKYFRKAGVPQPDGSLGRETSARQVVRRLAGCWTDWGRRYGYFDSADDAATFDAEITHMLINQMAAPNSPQWFNTGLAYAYGINGPAQGHYYVDPDSKELVQSKDAYTHPQPHACFIQSVDDDLVNDNGIMDLWVREARLFKYGSGTGTNFSNLRAEGEKLSGGGTSSGLMSFLRVGDRAAGAIKSGGTTRRAAKMVILDMDHPDIEKFINWKVQEEKKVAALMAAGYDGSYEGDAYQTVSGQNSNNSVRVPDAFIDAVRKDGSWDLLWRKTPGVARTVRARDLWDQIARAAWACADPGVQYDDIINSWHTCPAGGRIRASNPCVTGDTVVATDRGPRPVYELVGRQFRALVDGTSHRSTDRGFFFTGIKPVFQIVLDSGESVKATGNHQFFVVNSQFLGWKAVEKLHTGMHLRLHSHAPVFAGAGARQSNQGYPVGRISAIQQIGWLPVYDCTIPGVNAFDANGFYVHNCSEYMFLDDTACFAPETRISTPRGLQTVESLFAAQTRGQQVMVTTDIYSEHDHRRLTAHRPAVVTQVGKRSVLKMRLKDGREIRATGDHRFLTDDGQWKRLDQLVAGVDRVQIRESGENVAYSSDPLEVKRWQMLGWLTGDGVFHKDTVALVFGPSERATALVMTEEINGLKVVAANAAGGQAVVTRTSRISIQRNGVMQTTTSQSTLVDYLQRIYGFKQATATSKDVPSAIHSAPADLKVAYLQGLFSADGAIVRNGDATEHSVMLASSSPTLLRSVQLLLSDIGITSRIAWMHPNGRKNPQGQLRTFNQQARKFLTLVGFPCSVNKQRRAASILDSAYAAAKKNPRSPRVIEIIPDGETMVYDITEPVTHSVIAEGIIAHNCNLASINLMKFFDADKNLVDVDGYKHAVRLWTIVLEISVLMAQFPSRQIAKKSYEYRTLGLGYANLGALLMVSGIPYDSPRALAVTGALTAILTGESYAASAEMAAELGPFPKYRENDAHMLRVMRNHRRVTYNTPAFEYEDLSIIPMGVDQSLAPPYLLATARDCWDRALALGEQHGYRNAQVSCIAPTGTIALAMDCDTTGIEPDFALVKFKKLSGGGYFKIINQSLPAALRALGYSQAQIDDIVRYAKGSGSLYGAPYINHETLRARGFSDDDLRNIEKALPAVFELGFAFNHWTLGEAALQRLGFSPEQYKAPGFDLVRELGFSRDEVDAANDYICGTMTIEGAPHLKEEHYSVFDCANKCGKRGKRFIHHMGHVRIMAAAQPVISGALSKTVNVPNEAGVADIEETYMRSWELGLKAIALYRDGSKLSQPLSNKGTDKTSDKAADDRQLALSPELEERLAEARKARAEELGPDEILAAAKRILANATNTDFKRKVAQALERNRLPAKRRGWTQKAKIAGHTVFLRTGEYADGTLGEIFVDLHKEGASFRSLMNCFAIAVSIGLQYGVPLEEFVEKFTFTRFEPNGFVDHPNVKYCTSVIDYIFRVLGMEYLGRTDFVQVKPEDRDVDDPHHDDHAQAEFDALVSAQQAADEPRTRPVMKRALPAENVQSKVAQPNIDPGLAQQLNALRSQQAQLASMMGDAPLCDTCGSLTRRNGACYVCDSCGRSMGCS